ncbi:Alpha/Beta hydrolase protein [Pyronema omphalodes]|nr:Alpha/Beta hydrolase protein [Pyronema omphalodes]
MDATPLSPPPTNRNNPVDVGPEPYRVHIPTRYLELTQQKFADARLPSGDDSLRTIQIFSLSSYPSTLPFSNSLIHLIYLPSTAYSNFPTSGHEVFSWRHHEHSLNTHPQYRLSIPVAPFGPLRHHFLHHRTPAKRAPPILLISEHWDHIPLFTELAQRNICDVILPSAPGCGFSDAPESSMYGGDGGDVSGSGSGSGYGSSTGTTILESHTMHYTLHHVAQGFHTLMQRLGYDRYIIACSGLFGFTLSRHMSQLYPGSILGVHSCFLPTVKPVDWWGRIRTKRWGWKRRSGARDDGVNLEMGELERKAWEYAVTDSPMGLLAWVVARVREGSSGGTGYDSGDGCDTATGTATGTPRYKWTQTQILGAFMYYWISGPRGFLRTLDQLTVEEACGKKSKVPLGLLIGNEVQMKRAYVADCLGPVVAWEQKEEFLGRWVAFEKPQMVAEALVRFWESVVPRPTHRGSGWRGGRQEKDGSFLIDH